MSTKIEIETIDETHFRVRVTEGRSESTHDVTLNPNDYTKLTGGAVAPEELIRNRLNFFWSGNRRNPSSPILI